MKEKEPLISVIVPIYNRERYIKRCIDSIAEQSYTNIEIILVDDGSTDSSPIICRDYELKDERVIFIKKHNEGAGFARNIGIDRAGGKYLFFVDSDDYIHRDCLKLMVEAAIQYKADIVKCGYERGNTECFEKREGKNQVIHKNNINVFRSREMNIAVWGKLYLKKVISDIRYPKETLFDDEFFTYKCIYNAKNIVILSKRLYYNYMSEQSIMRSRKGIMPTNIILRAYKERIQFFDKREETELAGISYKELAIRLMLLYSGADRYENGLKERKVLYGLFKKYYKLACEYAVNGMEKASIKLFYYMPNMMTKILKMVGISN